MGSRTTWPQAEPSPPLAAPAVACRSGPRGGIDPKPVRASIFNELTVQEIYAVLRWTVRARAGRLVLAPRRSSQGLGCRPPGGTLCTRIGQVRPTGATPNRPALPCPLQLKKFPGTKYQGDIPGPGGQVSNVAPQGQNKRCRCVGAPACRAARPLCPRRRGLPCPVRRRPLLSMQPNATQL